MVAPAEKASLLGYQFDSKQYSEQFVSPLSSFPQYRCNSLVFRTSVLLRLILDLDSYGNVDPVGVFPLFVKKIADINAQKLGIIFRMLIHLGSFPESWRSANVTAIPKGAPSPDTENYRPILITPILSKVNEKLVSHKLPGFCRKYGLLPAAQFAYIKGLGCTHALLSVSHHLQQSLDAGMESYIVQVDFVQPSI